MGVEDGDFLMGADEATAADDVAAVDAAADRMGGEDKGLLQVLYRS